MMRRISLALVAAVAALAVGLAVAPSGAGDSAARKPQGRSWGF